MLDENGKDVMSEQIADLIGDAGNTVCFVALATLFIITELFFNHQLLRLKFL